jgi:hypothetical protein
MKAVLDRKNRMNLFCLSFSTHALSNEPMHWIKEESDFSLALRNSNKL